MAEIIAFNKGRRPDARQFLQADQKAIRNMASDIQILANTLIDHATMLGDEQAALVENRLTPLRNELRNLEDFVLAMTTDPKRPA